MRIFHHSFRPAPGTVFLSSLLLGFLFWLFVLPFFQSSQLKLELEMKGHDHAQVFWVTRSIAGGGSGYSQENSLVKRLRPGKTEAIFTLPSVKLLKKLRIDPSTRETTFALRSISITQPGFKPFVIDSAQAIREYLSLQDIRLAGGEDGGTVLKTLGEDPQMIVRLQPEFVGYLQYVKDQKARYASALTAEMDLLGLDFAGLLFLCLDLLFLLSISATLVGRTGLGRKSSAELCVLLGLTGIAVVVLSVTLCGMLSWLSWRAVLVSHAALWLVIHAYVAGGINRKIPEVVRENFRRTFGMILASLVSILNPAEQRAVNYLNALLLASVILLLISFFLPAALTLPLNFDSNDYRLSRVGYWLQQGNIYQFTTNDIRQIIMPSNCDLAMAWITSFFKKGYPLVHLISFYGGLLVCFSIYALSRRLNFPRQFSLIAVLIWLGIPNSASQMLTSQTDLFTTGCLMTGLYCFFQAVRHRSYGYYLFAGLGIGLAVGAKSTVFLWGPGLLFLCLAIIAAHVRKLEWKVFAGGIALLTLFALLSGGFVYGQNFLRYKNFLGPAEVVSSISDKRDPVVKKAGVRKKMSKLDFVELRAKAYLWQIFEPNSNLPIVKSLSKAAFVSIEDNIYQTNKTLKSSFVSMFKAATSWLRGSNRLSEDYASFGMVAFLLLICGGTLALGRSIFIRDPQSIAVALLFGAVVLYGLFFCWVVGWTVHRYRYAVLVTPFIAVTGTYFLHRLTAFSNRFCKIVAVAVVASVLLYQTAMAVTVATNSRSHGWFAFLHPEKVHSYIFYWRDAKHLTDRLPDSVHRLGLVLAKGSWKSMFYRTGRDIQSFIIPVTGTIDATYAFLDTNRYDALITRNLSSVSIEDHFNLIPSLVNTYQALLPAAREEDRVAWIVANGHWSDGWVKLRGEVRIGNWKRKNLSLELCNPAPVAETIVLKSSVRKTKVELQANSECEKIDIPVNDNDFISWRITPGYHPWKESNSKEVRSLGVLVKFPKPE